MVNHKFKTVLHQSILIESYDVKRCMSACGLASHPLQSWYAFQTSCILRICIMYGLRKEHLLVFLVLEGMYSTQKENCVLLDCTKIPIYYLVKRRRTLRILIVM